MALCWSCSKVKGKRNCPARGGDLICSRCCGTKRRIEIQCPAECPYLHGSHDKKWASESREKEAAHFFAGAFSLEERPAQFYLFLHHVIVTKGKPFLALEDGEFRDVVDTAVKTLETRAKGILYRHPAASPHLEALSTWLIGIVTMREKITGAPAVSDEEVFVALQALLAAVTGRAGVPATTRERYLEQVERILSEHLSNPPPIELPTELDPPRSSVILSP